MYYIRHFSETEVGEDVPPFQIRANGEDANDGRLAPPDSRRAAKM